MASIKKDKAIVVEDSDEIWLLAEFILERQNYEVTRAADGDEALSLIDNATPPNLVLLDVVLPSLDGISLLKHLRAKPAWKEVPVLMMTAKSQEEDVRKAFEAGASDYIVKPFDPMELIMRIRRLSGKQ